MGTSTPSPPTTGMPGMQAAPVSTPKPVEDRYKVSEADPNALIRGFVNKKNPNLTKLIQVGQMNSVPDPNSPTGRKDWGRMGDITIRFQNGYWTGGRSEGDTERIAWCEAEAAKLNAEVMDVSNPQAKIWSELVAGQQVTARRDPTVSPSVDVNSALRGEAALSTGGEQLDRVLSTIAIQNEELETNGRAPEPEPELPPGVTEQPQTSGEQAVEE